MELSFDRIFFKQLGLSDLEIDRLLPNWCKAKAWAQISERDMCAAAQRCSEFWNLELKGIRKCIMAYIYELIEAARMSEYKDRGDKLLYGNMPVHPACMIANRIAGKGKLHVCHPEFLIHVVHNAFLCKSEVNKQDEALMSKKCRHCGMNASRINAFVSGRMVLPDAMWNWGFMCNEGFKTDEMLQCMLGPGWHSVISTLPHDSYAQSTEADDLERVKRLAAAIEAGQDEVTSYTGIPVSKQDLCLAIDELNMYTKKISELTDLVCTADPQPLTGAELSLFSLPLGMSFDTGFENLVDAIDTTIAEVKELINAGKGVLPKGAPKMGCYFTPCCVPWVCDAFTREGINLSINTFHGKLSKIYKAFDREFPYEAVARQWLSQPNAVNMENQAGIIEDMMADYPVDAMLYGFFAFDRWIGALQKTTSQIVEERTGVPHYYMEGDFWNDIRFMDGDKKNLISGIAHQLKVRKIYSGGTE